MSLLDRYIFQKGQEILVKQGTIMSDSTESVVDIICN